MYSHIIDDDRRKNAELFEDAFYAKNNLNPSIVKPEDQKAEDASTIDPELLAKMAALSERQLECIWPL